MNRLTPRQWLLLLLLAGIALRVGFWFIYEPISYPDTRSYMRVAVNILEGDFSTYDGRRPPGYPAVLALGGGVPDGVWALQMLMGLGISALIFAIMLSATGRPGLAAALGMTYNLNLAQLFFEANLTSETTSTLLVVALVAALVMARRRLAQDRRQGWLLVGLGTLAGAALLTRPQFVFLPLVLALIVGMADFNGGIAFRRVIGRAVIVALPGILMIVAWSSFNYARHGHFTLSTQMGIGLMNQSLAFIELAPDRYATIRDIYVKHRDAKMARTGRHNANWDAVPELMATTGLSLPALSRELGSLSVYLFLHHPVRYGIGVARGWIDFWLVPNYWTLEKVRPESLATALTLVWRVEHPLLRLVNALFLLMCAAVLLSARVRHRIGLDLTFASIVAIVLATSLVQALGEWGENARYGVPVQALVVVAVVLAARRWLAAAPSRVTVDQPATG